LTQVVGDTPHRPRENGTVSMSKLKPRAKGFYTQFKGLAQAVADGAAVFARLAENSVDAADQADRLTALADAGDANYDAVLDSLHASFITPFDRDQIQALASSLTAALRHMEGAASLAKMLAPPPLPQEFKQIAVVLERCSAATVDAVERLSKLKGLRTYRTEIRRLSTEAELARRELLVTMTTGAFEPLDAVKLRVVLDELTLVVAAFRAAAEVVESVLIAEG
jgi:uncharacterized protein Yka (UPF0111/DUF47 family)